MAVTDFLRKRYWRLGRALSHVGDRLRWRPVPDAVPRRALDLAKLEERVLLSASPIGPELMANTESSGGEMDAAVAVDADGDFVAVWSSDESGSFEIFGQLFNSGGVAQGDEFRVNSTTASDQLDVSVAMDADGNFMVAWTSDQNDSTDIFAQRFDASGAAQGGEFRVNSSTDGIQSDAQVVMDPDGNFVISWQTADVSGATAEFAQRFDAAGVASGGHVLTHVATPAGPHSGPHTDLDSPIVPAEGATRHELVFIDSSVQNFQPLVFDAWRNQSDGVQFHVVVLDSTRDGIEQISQTLTGYDDLDAIHFVTHATDHAIQFGGTWISPDNLAGYSESIAGWGSALAADGDLLFYGCELAGGDAGRSLLESFGTLTGADVAASTDDTGHTSLGGDWVLEYTGGRVQTGIVFSAELQEQWRSLLATATFQEGAGGYVGTQDTELRSGSPNTPNGSNTTMTVDLNDGGSQTQGLIRFDDIFGNGAGQVPYGSTITSATLTVYVTDTSSGSTEITLHRMLVNWSEASTWGSLVGGVQLDDVEALSATDATVASPTSTGSQTITGLAAALQSWSYGSANDGWVLVTNSTNGWDFVTSEGGTASQRPQLSVTYTPNTAPSLDASKSPALSPISEDAGAPSGAVGSLVSQVVDFASPSGQVDNVTDPDSGALLGIAITAADTANGTWYYSTNDGTGWNALGAVSNSSARLLAADASTRVYFQPNADYNGTIATTITFGAWDRTWSSNGSTADTSSNGGTTAFSTATDTASLTVTAVNDAPVNTVPAAQSTNEDTAKVFSSGNGNQISISDIDTGGNPVQVTLTDTNGAITLAGTAGLTFSVGDGTSDSTMTFTGTVANINTALNGLSFSPTSDFNGAASLQIITNDQGNGGAGGALTDTDTVAITVNPVNDAPVITSNGGGVTASVSVAENTTAVTTVTSTDPDGGTPVYSISGGADAALFTINSSAGVLTFVSARNFEAPADVGADNVYDVTVEVSDGNGGTDTQAISVTITDVDEFDVGAISDTNAAANAVNENAANGSTVGLTAFASDADGSNNTITYSLDDSAGGRFAINGSNGVVTVADGSLLDREAASSHNITVRATSSDGSFSTQTFTITVNDVDEFDVGAVSDTNVAADAVNENAANGSTVGVTAFASDADATNNTITYSLDDTAGGRFAVNSATGVVTVADGSLLDREAAASHNITVRATSADGSFSTLLLTIAINPVNDNNPVINSNGGAATAAISMAENTTVVTTVTATDADLPAQTLTYSISGGADAAKFAINSSTGELSFVSVPDYEAPTDSGANNVYDVTVQVSDGAGGTDSQAIAVTVTNINEGLWLSTTGNVSGSGVPGPNAWSKGEVLLFGDPNLDFDPGSGVTNGTFSGVFDAQAFASGVNVDAVEYVTRTVTVGGGANTITLQAGDVLLSLDGSATLTSANSLAVTMDEVFLFRPTTPGNYSSGTFTMVLDNFGSIHGGSDTWSLAVVEQATTIGDYTLNAGAFLFSRQGGAEHGDIRIFTPTGVGTGTTAGSVQILVEGSDAGVGISTKIYGLELVLEPTTIGGVTLTAGTILMAVDASDTIGSNNLSVMAHDVFALNFTQTTLGSGSATATATLLLDGSDVGLNTGAEELDGLALYSTANNQPPVITSNGGGATASISVAENTTAVTTVTSTDVDGGTPVYSISGGADAALFSINSLTGALNFVAARNYEAPADVGADNVYDVTVEVSDGNGGTDTQAISVTVTDIDEFDIGAISDTNAVANAVNENAANGSTVGLTAFASDADGSNNTITYSLDDSAGGRFAIDGSTGVVTVADGTLLDRESAASHNITLRATSADTSFSTQTFTITINPLNDNNPVITSNGGGATASISIAENATAVTTITATDADVPAQTLSHSITGGVDAALFSIDSSSGVLSFVAPQNRETPADANGDSIYELTVQVSDGAGGTDSQAISVTVTDVDEFDVGAVTDTNAASNAVNENAANGTVVGVTASASDADATTNTITYALDDSAGGRFAINSVTGVVTVADGTLLDRESAASHNIVVRATSADGSFSTQTFTINLNDVDEFDVGAVTDSNVAGNSVDENAANGTVVGVTASASDADATTNTITYALDDSGGGRFAINSVTGVVTVADGTLLDRESAASHNIVVRATSNDGSISTQTFTITVNEVDEFDVGVVSDTNGAADAVNENAANGSTVGVTAFASDADATNNTITYSLDDDAGGRFTINAATGVVTVNGAIDYETATSHSVTVRATSTDGAFATQNFTIDVSDTNDSVPEITAGQSFSVAEDSANGTAAGTVAATDADTVGSVQNWTITAGNTDGIFAIDPATGAITVADNRNLNFEASSSYTLTITVSDGVNSSVPQTITIAVHEVVIGPPTSPPDSGFDDVVPPRDDPPDSDSPGDGGSAATPPHGEPPQQNRRGEHQRTTGGFSDNSDGAQRSVRPGLLADEISQPGHNHDWLHSFKRPMRQAARTLARLQSPDDLRKDLTFAVDTDLLWEKLDSLHEQLDGNKVPFYTVGTATALTTALSAGYVWWTLRGGYLIASALSSLPAWRLIDPLPILQSFAVFKGSKEEKERRREQEESLASLVTESQRVKKGNE